MITQLTQTTSELFGASLNFLLQWIVLTFFYSRVLGFTLGLGVLLTSGVILILDPWVKKEAQKVSEKSTQLTRLLPGVWERTIQNNPGAAPLWQKRFTETFNHFYYQSLKSVHATVTLSGASLFLSQL